MTAGLDFSKPEGNELQLRQAIAIAAGIPNRKPRERTQAAQEQRAGVSAPRGFVHAACLRLGRFAKRRAL